MDCLTEYNPNHGHPLAPLRKGRPVTLAINPRDVKAKRRIPRPRLFLVPLSNAQIAIALEGSGCEVMDITELKPLWLIKMGLTRRAAKVLVEELKSELLDIRRYADGE